MDPTTATPIAGLDETLDVTLDAAGARWTVVGFGEGTVMVSEVRGPRMLLLDADQAANAEVVTIGDAIEAAVEEAASPIDVWMLSVLLLHGAVLLTPRASLGPVLAADGITGFACLLGTAGVPAESLAWSGDTLGIDPRTGQPEIEQSYATDTSAFAAARTFLVRATRRGARLAIERFEARHPLPTSIRPPFLAALATAACNAAAAC